MDSLQDQHDSDSSRETKRIKIDQEDFTTSVLGISEKDVGISEYFSPALAGFKGTIKSRYTDFLVNEILPDGNVLYLTDVGLLNKKDKRLEKREEERKEKTTGELNDSQAARSSEPITPQISIPDPSDEQKQKLKQVFGETILDQIAHLAANPSSKLEPQAVVSDKEQRGALHQLVREAYSSKLDTKTTAENKFVISVANSSYSRQRKSKVDKSGLGKHQNYVHFTLYKENKETVEVAHTISRFLRIPSKSISYAGTKDRRGVTVQRACASKIAVERLNGLNQVLRGIKLGGFEYKPGQLSLGDLKGNEFYITIRNVRGIDGLPIAEDQINQSLQSLKDNGFINYYGMQRFGTFSISTHQIGVPLLQGNWDQAVQLILSEQELTIEESKAARKVWSETKDASKALAIMPKKCVAESCILKSLVKDPKSPANAIAQIPRNLRIIYVHAYQSYIWNYVVSKRFELFGSKVVKGDLIIETEKEPPLQVDDDDLLEDVKAGNFARARPVTAEEVDSLTIFDIVLPTPGFDVVFPENDLLDVYKQVMEKDGLDPLQMRRNVKDFSLSGSYRHIAVKPGQVDWWFKRYNSDTDQLVQTDLEIMEQGGQTGVRMKESEHDIAKEEPEDQKLALVLKMHLGSSQYATMALREIMKLDTARRGEGFF